VLYFDNFWHEDTQNEFLIICMLGVLCTIETGDQLTIAGDVYKFQQDSTPAHRARETIVLLQPRNAWPPTSYLQSPDLWSPSSPDLNRVDYRIWGIIQDRVYRKSVKTRMSLNCVCLKLAQASIKVHLNACVDAKGKHFEHRTHAILLWLVASQL